MNLNPNCDGAHCIAKDGEVRVLPTGGDGNAILCKQCFYREMLYRRDRNASLSVDCQFDLPSWFHLKIYAPEVAT